MKIHEAINSVMANVGYVQKTGQNTFHRYKYASAEDVVSAVRGAMVANGLSLFPKNVEHSVEEIHPTKSGGRQYRTVVRVTWQLAHVSGDVIEFQSYGCGVDGEDKGVYKAMTGAQKYALVMLFQLPTTDDPESYEIERDQPGRAEPAPPAAPDPDPSWGEDSKVFKARVRDALGSTASFKQYAEDFKFIQDLCRFLGRPTPEYQTRAQRERLIQWLGTEQAAEKMYELLERQGMASG